MQIVWLVIGIALVTLVSRLAHGEHGHDHGDADADAPHEASGHKH
jgi:zinc and cadmium transporter